MQTPLSLILTSVDDRQQAEQLADGLVTARLAACIQISAPGHSVYLWNNRIERDAEHYLQIKTIPDRADQAIAWLEQHHPYEAPEIIRLDGEAAGAYGDWLLETCR